MFNLREFIKKGMLSAVGKMADYQVILNSAGWFEKGVLLEADLAEINSVIEAKHVAETERETTTEEASEVGGKEIAEESGSEEAETEAAEETTEV